MKKTLITISLLLVLGLLVAGCSKPVDDVIAPGTDSGETPTGENTGDENTLPDQYIEEQIISENETVEIGEMI